MRSHIQRPLIVLDPFEELCKVALPKAATAAGLGLIPRGLWSVSGHCGGEAGCGRHMQGLVLGAAHSLDHLQKHSGAIP